MKLFKVDIRGTQFCPILLMKRKTNGSLLAQQKSPLALAQAGIALASRSSAGAAVAAVATTNRVKILLKCIVKFLVVLMGRYWVNWFKKM